MIWSDIDGDGRKDKIFKAYGKNLTYSLNQGETFEEIVESLQTF